MSKTYRDWSTDQAYLFPPSPHDWLPEDDLVYFLLDTVATLDLTPIFAHYERELRGQPPFHPRIGLLPAFWSTSNGSCLSGGNHVQTLTYMVFSANFSCRIPR
jgi:hypothetical protein